MLTVATDVPQLAVPALAALVRTGKVGTCLKMVCQPGDDFVTNPALRLYCQVVAKVDLMSETVLFCAAAELDGRRG